jgi:secretion/DNA translocation related CpaE-like protein
MRTSSLPEPDRPAPAHGTPPVLVTADDALAAETLRLAAAAGTPVDVVPVGGGVRRWGSAATVLVGPDQVETLAALLPARREQVHVVCLGAAPERLFRAAVQVGAGSVLELPDAADWLMQLLADVTDGQQRRGALVAVSGASGGVGATVLAAALALVAGRRGPAALIDLDPGGPGLGRTVGMEPSGGVTWDDLAHSPGRLGSRALREALPRRDNVGVLDWPEGARILPSPASVHEVVEAARRGHDRVVLDVPRGAHGLPEDLLARCDDVLLVVRASLGPVSAAARLAARMLAEGAPLRVVVRSRRRDQALAAEVARAVGAPLAGHLADQRRLDEHLDLGVGPVFARRGPLARLARELVDPRGGRP